MGFLKRSSS